jgi:hypothetical protein
MIKSLLLNIYRNVPLPVPITSFVYSAIRQWVYHDRRTPLFDAAFLAVAAGTQGDYMEFGVFRGTSFIMAYKMAAKHRLDKNARFFAFDSFQGLPWSEGTVMTKGNYASPRSLFETLIRKAGVDTSRVVTIEGLYNETLTGKLKQDYQIRRAAVIHVDCDLYLSTKEVLRFVEDIIGPGTILIFDDWYSFRKEAEDIENLGERRAFREWGMRDRFFEFHDIVNANKAFIMRE